MQLTVFGYALALIAGTTGAIFRTAPIRLLNVIGAVYVEFFRNTPLLVQMFFYFYGLPAIGIRLSGFASGVLGLGFYTGAFVTEAIRAGIGAVSHGQIEAARSLGLGPFQTLRTVILPQALATSLPPLGSLASACVRNSAIASVIAVGELMYNGQILNSRTFQTYEIFGAVGLFYLCLTLPLGYLINVVDKQLNRFRAA